MVPRQLLTANEPTWFRDKFIAMTRLGRGQDWNYTGILVGFSAVFWSLFLMFHAWRLRNFVELWHSFAQFWWLAANAW